MPKTLTDTQRVILAHAAARDTHRVLPTATSLQKNAGSISMSLRALLAAGLIVEVPAREQDVAWRTEDHQTITLNISQAGLDAIGVTDPGPDDVQTSAPAAATPPRTGSKLALLIERLSAADGATVDELAIATEWQKHSVRGAMSGPLKKTRGIELSSNMVEGRGRVYRIAVGQPVPTNSDN